MLAKSCRFLVNALTDTGLAFMPGPGTFSKMVGESRMSDFCSGQSNEITAHRVQHKIKAERDKGTN